MSNYESRPKPRDEAELSRHILDAVYENLDIALLGVAYFKKKVIRWTFIMGFYCGAMIFFAFALDRYVPVVEHLGSYGIFVIATVAIAICFYIIYRRNWQAYWDAWKEAKSQVRTLCEHYDAIGITNQRVLAQAAEVDGALQAMPERMR